MLLFSLVLLAAMPSYRLTTASGVRVRAEAKKDGRELARLGIGVVFEVEEELSVGGDTWHETKTPSGAMGFVFAGLSAPFEPARKNTMYLALAQKRFAAPELVAEDARDLVDFLSRATQDADDPAAKLELELNRLRALRKALDSTDIAGQQAATFRRSIKKYDADVVPNDSAGVFVVLPMRLWEAHDKAKGMAFAEAFAWEAVNAPHTGECEGFLPCNLAWLKSSEGRYLETYPSGAHADDAVRQVGEQLALYIAEGDAVYSLPAEDRPEAKAAISALQRALSKSKAKNKQSVLTQLGKLVKLYKL